MHLPTFNFKHFIFLNISDALTTWYLLSYVSGVGELNPIYSWAYSEIGLVPGIVLLKLFWLGLIGWLYTRPSIDKKIIEKYNITYKKVGINTICVIFMFVPLNNLILIIKAF